MHRISNFLLILTIMALPSAISATALPSQVATIVVHGFDAAGASNTGVFGDDGTNDYTTELAGVVGLPLSTVDPSAPNQVAYTTYYGDQYPSYYTQQDKDDLDAVTLESGGGVPRYAMIISKFAKEVMRRSGATQVNLVGVSFGGLISRYMIEKNVGELASTGKIARWIAVEGVVAGNFAATWGGIIAKNFFDTHYGGQSIDFDQMNYAWVEANINNPRESSDSPYFATFPTHFWLASDDNLYSKAITTMSGKANDGVVLLEDAVLRSLPPEALYLGLQPTVSAMHTTHESTKDFEGLRAGIAAQLFSRQRVTITLDRVRVLNEFDGGARGQGEYVFGLKVFSPKAETDYGVTKPIHQLRAEDNNFEFLSMAPNTWFISNIKWFDDMILPGETQLRLETNVEEIDGDIIYNIAEESGESRTALANTSTTLNLLSPGSYTLATTDWEADITVEVTDYPEFEDNTPATAAKNWALYE